MQYALTQKVDWIDEISPACACASAEALCAAAAQHGSIQWLGTTLLYTLLLAFTRVHLHVIVVVLSTIVLGKVPQGSNCVLMRLPGYKANLAAAGESDSRLEARLAASKQSFAHLSLDNAVSAMPRLQVPFCTQALACIQ